MAGLGWRGPADYPDSSLVLLGSRGATGPDAQETILPVLISTYLRPGGVGPQVKSSVLFLGTAVLDRALYKRLLGMSLELLEAQERLIFVPFHSTQDPVSLIKEHHAKALQKDHRLLVVIEGFDQWGLHELSATFTKDTHSQKWILLKELVDLVPVLTQATILLSLHFDLHDISHHLPLSQSDLESRMWRCLLAHAHTVIKVLPLPSGLSRQIHGQLEVFRGGRGFQSSSPVKARSWLFCSTDQSIQLMSKGGSSFI